MDGMTMTANDVLVALHALADAGIPCWIGGGWGIDALVGDATRRHRDLDIALPAHLDQAAILALMPQGYALVEDQRPARFVVQASSGRAIDLHPVVFNRDGHGVQQGFAGVTFDYPPEGFTQGLIAGETVPCLTAERQVAFHLGYAPLEQDRRDMAVLRDRLGIVIPAPY